MSTRGALALLCVAFWLRLLLVPLSFYVSPLLAEHALGNLLSALPVGVTLLALAGFLLLGREERRSSLYAQLTAATMATEVLFDLVILVAPSHLSNMPVRYLIEGLRVAALVGTWVTLGALAAELETRLSTSLSALFFFAVAVRAGLYGARAFLSSGEPIDLHRIDLKSAIALFIALALPLLQAMAAGALRRFGKAPAHKP
ncbi:MAG: hypothetical protein ABI321_08230 [Polyangia bacterium]